jgi:hypothetical protein
VPEANQSPDRKLSVEQWLEIRKEAASNIDPATARTTWTFADVLDPYGVEPRVPKGLSCIGRTCFARAPGSEIWVWYGDLPDEVRRRLIERPELPDDLPF